MNFMRSPLMQMLFARAIAYAIEQPGDVDVNEIIIRPTRQEL
jgi:NADP-dependent 3-hydroxy acid dehydrogenase YdfG